MWNVHGAYAFHALAVGASAATAVDVMAATPEFVAANDRVGQAVRFVQADINDPTTAAAVGEVDVLLCSGVVYHMPDPLWTLRQLRRASGDILILGSATIPEQAAPQGAVFFPLLDDRARRRLAYATPSAKVGLDSAFDPTVSYSNWYWGLSPTCLAAMVRTAGFELCEQYAYRRAAIIVARAAHPPRS